MRIPICLCSAMTEKKNLLFLFLYPYFLTFENLATSREDFYSGNLNEKVLKYLASQMILLRDEGTEVYISHIILNLCFSFIFIVNGSECSFNFFLKSLYNLPLGLYIFSLHKLNAVFVRLHIYCYIVFKFCLYT